MIVAEAAMEAEERRRKQNEGGWAGKGLWAKERSTAQEAAVGWRKTSVGSS